MDSHILQLQFRVATLEAQLLVQRRENERLKVTNEYLTEELADVKGKYKLLCNDRGLIESDGQFYYARRVTHGCRPCSMLGDSIKGLTDYLYSLRIGNSRADERSRANTSEGCRDLKEQPNKPQNSKVQQHGPDLIDLEPTSPSKTRNALRGSAEVSYLTKAQNHEADGANDDNYAQPKKASSDSMTTESLTDKEVLTHSYYDNIDKPPKLDLHFRGLRTTQDGPEKSNDHAESFNSRWSGHTPSFDEIFLGQSAEAKKMARELEAQEQAEQITAKENNEAEPSATRGLTSDAMLKKVSNDVTSFSQSASYRSSLPSEFSEESASLVREEYQRKSLTKFHGIRYTPKQDDFFINRTRIMVFNLPIDIKIADILSKIRGGMIISCQLLDTKFAYGTQSAMIRFSSYIEAMRCVDYATTSPITFDGTSASVQLIPTASYPLAPEIYKNIFQRGHTRSLKIECYRQKVPRYIQKRYSNPQYIEWQAMNAVGDWIVRFTSVERASALWEDLEVHHVPKGQSSGFLPDPCDDAEFGNAKVWEAKDIKVIETGDLNWKI